MLAGGVGRPPVCGTNRHPWLVIPPGSAGVPPASLFLQTASHPRPLPCKARQARLDGVLLHRVRSCAARRPPGARASRPHPYSCKQPPMHGHSPARRAKPALTGFSSIVPGLVRRDAPRERGRPARILIPANSLPSKATPLQGAPSPPLRGSLPSCQVLCGRDARVPGGSMCGRDARVPGGSGETPAFPGDLYSFPVPDPWRTPLDSPSTPSCPFVEYSFRTSSSHYSSNCRSLLRIFSRLILAESRVGSRERARSMLRIASSDRSRKYKDAPMPA